MLSKRRRNFLFVEAAILTLCVYFLGIFLNSYLDDTRLSVLDEHILESQLEQRSSIAFKEFQHNRKNLSCEKSKERIIKEQKQLQEFATDISNFGLLFNTNNEEFSKLRQREFYLLQTQLYFTLEDHNQKCENKVLPGWYFYDGNNPSFDRQAANVETFVLASRNGSIFFSYDINFVGNEVVIEELMNKFNVTFTPYVVIGNKTHNDYGGGLISAGRLLVDYREQVGVEQ